MITRRKLIVTSLMSMPALLLRSSDGRADDESMIELKGAAPTFEGTPMGSAPGDYGYRHDLYHADYQALFGASGHCSCGSGDCRVTIWRETKLDSPMGYDIVAWRNWYPLPANVWMPDTSSNIPLELYREWAHVCAYRIGYNSNAPTIACALINKKQA
ncbi:MAG: hypothetical protein P4L81_05665 [Candidatus Pacebacteria bacterium]|nr:hypothetical protein [Candidatus Paceibacterota bacterium]